MKTIMIIDDDLALLKEVSLAFHEVFQVVCFSNGEEAAKYLSSNHTCDLILLDLQMPGASGHTVLMWLKSNETTKHIPVIYLSGKGDTENVMNGLQLGAVDFIVKPFQKDTAFERISRVLQH